MSKICQRKRKSLAERVGTPAVNILVSSSQDVNRLLVMGVIEESIGKFICDEYKYNSDRKRAAPIYNDEILKKVNDHAKAGKDPKTGA